ncbi:MAG: hypothetical protein WKG00_25845 [Polyangiaceae bacterium]
MGEPLGADEASEIAAAFLGDYWRNRVERAGTEDALRAGFRDVFLRGLEAQPDRSIAVDELREALEERLGAGRVAVRAKGKLATVDIAGISTSTAKDDFAALQAVVAGLGSHATLAEIAIEGKPSADAYRAGATWSLRARCQVPLANTLFFGEPPAVPRPAIEHGLLVDDSDRLRLDLISCPLCGAEHAVFYNAKSHTQDSEDVPFACLACSRYACRALGIPELSSYRIDLAHRLPPRLADFVRRHRAQLARWRAEPGATPLLDGLQTVLWATVVVPAVLLVLAWRSPEFRDPVFVGARTLATVACAAHAVAVAVLNRSLSSAALSWLPFTFAAIFALMIPVLVAMWG